MVINNDLNNNLQSMEIDYTEITPIVKKLGIQRCLLSISSLISMTENFPFLAVLTEWISFLRNLYVQEEKSVEKLNRKDFKLLIELLQQKSTKQLAIWKMLFKYELPFSL